MPRRKGPNRRSREVRNRRAKSGKPTRRIGGMEPLEDRRLLAADVGIESVNWQDYVPAEVLNDPEIVVSQPDTNGNIRVIIETIGKAENQAVIDNFGTGAKNVSSLNELPIVLANIPVDQLDDVEQLLNVRSVSVDYAVPPALADSVEVIGADVVHDNGTRGAGTTIAILDSGIDSDHDFFGTNGSRIVEERCFSTAGSGEQSLCPNGQATDVSADTSGSVCFDDGDSICDHGTHVAGIAAGSASTDSDAPGDGVAPGANIIAVQVFHRENDSCGSRPVPCVLANNSDILAGLNAVASINALQPDLNVVSANMSIGGGTAYQSACDNDFPDARVIKTAIDNLLTGGVATVIAAGNRSFQRSVGSPACISSAFTVGSTTTTDAVSGFSNRGTLLDVFAPGGGDGILENGGITSSVSGGGYAAFSGTSMAAPHVAGALAVLREADPDRSITDLMNDLVENGEPITYDSLGTNVTTPRINVLGSLSGDSNDTIGEATKILLGSTNSDFSLGETYDVDMFEFTVNGGPQSVFIEVVERDNSNLDPFLRLFDASGTELAADSNIGSASAELDVVLPGAGTYFIGVSSENNEDYDPNTGFGDADGDASGRFTLTINDNNDQLGEALPISLNQTESGDVDADSDVDLYAFSATAGQTVNFDLDRTDGSSLDSVLRLFSPDGTTQIAIDDDGENGQGPLPEVSIRESFLEFTFPTTDTYFLGVSSFQNSTYNLFDDSDDNSGSSTGGYELTAFVDNLDGNDQLSEAVNVPIGTTAGVFQLFSSNDVTMFSTTVAAGQTVGFDVDNFGGDNLDAELRLWDADGNQLRVADDVAGPAPEFNGLEPYIEHTFNDAGTYFVSVAVFDNDGFDPISGLFDDGTSPNLGRYQVSITDQTITEPANRSIVTIANDLVGLDGETSLREAIEFANSNPGTDTITFAPSVGSTITLTEGELDLSDALIVAGPGATSLTISGNNQSRIFDATRDLTIQDLTLANGNANSISDGSGGAINGEDVTILRSRLVNNTASSQGGAIFINPFGDLVVTDSEFSGNSADEGGAISINAGSGFTASGEITNSTISGNTADDGGGIYARGANLSVRNSTIAFNSGGIQSVANAYSNSAIVSDSIIARNGRTDFDGEVRLFDSLLESDRNTTIDFVQSGAFLLDVDPMLAPLGFRAGAETQTHQLLERSPAIGRATVSGNTPSTDQTGRSRVRYGAMDMGADESSFETFSGVVTITSDIVAVDGETSLREAVARASSDAFVESVTFDPSLNGQTITVTAGEMFVERAVTISGPGADQLTIDAGGNSRLFNFNSGTDDIPDDPVDPTTSNEGETFVIRDVMLTGGAVPAPQAGGAINLEDSLDTLELDSVVISNSSGNAGGAIRLAGNYVIQDSTFTGNTANFAGAAIFATGESDGFIVNSTISGNTSNSGAGAIQAQSNANATMQILNSTVADNSAAAINIFAYGGGSAEITVANSILANNTGVNVSNAGGSFISNGHNLSDDGSAGFNGIGDLTNTNPLLGPLQNNGGTTPTHSLLTGSPAINAGDPAFAGLAFDQRGNGFARIVDGRVDIGSYEEQVIQGLACDFNGDGNCSGADINLLQANIVNGPTDPATFDLTGDGFVTVADRNEWLALAGAENLASGNAYLPGDANLDGVVDASDFNVWNANKFTSTTDWTRADFNADGVVDASDFNVWNANKFKSADTLLRSEESGGDREERRELQLVSLLDQVFADFDV